MQLNHSRPPSHGSRVNSLRTGNFFVVKALGRSVTALWRSLCSSSGTTTPPDRIFHNRVTTRVWVLCSSDPRAHFRFGTESEVASFEVCRPSGILQSLTDVAADQVLKIEGHPK
jgi:ASPIC and UnbV